MSSFTPVGVEALIKGLDTFERGLEQMQAGLKDVSKQTDSTASSMEKASETNKKFSLSLTDIESAFKLVERVIGAAKRVYDELVGITLENAKAQIDFARMTGMAGEEAYKLIEIGDDLQISQSALTMAIKAMSEKGIEPTIESFIRLGEQYRALPSQAEKNKFAVDNFGRSGLELQKILELDADAIRAMGEEALATGKYLSGPAKEAMEEYRLTVDGIGDSWNGFKTQMGLGLSLMMTGKDVEMSWLESQTYAIQVVNELEMALRKGIISQEEYNEQEAKITYTSYTAADAALYLKDALNQVKRETQRATNAVEDSMQTNKEYGPTWDTIVNGVDDTTRSYEDLLSPAEKVAARQAEIDEWNKRVADSTARVKAAQDNLATAYDNLKAAQDNWKESTATDVAGMLADLGEDSAKYEDALLAIDETMGTNLAGQDEFKDSMQDLTAEYAKTGDIDAFKEGLKKLFDFMNQDTAVQKAKDEVTKYIEELNKIPSLIETYVYTYYIDVEGGPSGGGWKKGKKGEPIEQEREPLSLAARAVQTMTTATHAATAGYSALSASIRKLTSALEALAGSGKKNHKGKLKILEGLFTYAEGFSNFASALVDRYESTVIDPLQDGLDVLDETIERYKEWDTTVEDLAAGFISFGQAVMGRYQERVGDPLAARIEAYDERIKFLTEKQTAEGLSNDEAKELYNLQKVRTYAAEKYADVQERIVKLQQKQADFEYLQQQMEFLRFMTEHGLDPESILGGVELGLGANYEDLLDAMMRATSQVIEDEQEKLENYEEEQLRKAEELAAMEEERARAAEELAAAQAKVLEIQQKQADIEFLKQQFEFLKFMKDNGLNPEDILGGLELGLGADLPALLDAMAAAMQQVIEKAQEELGIGSPSKVFMRIGGQIMTGLTQGIGGLVGAPLEAMRVAAAGLSSVAQMAMPSLAPAYAGSGGRTVNVNISGTSINNGMDWATFQASVKHTVKEAMRYG